MAFIKSFFKIKTSDWSKAETVTNGTIVFVKVALSVIGLLLSADISTTNS